jgi:cytochrome c551/c552
MLQGIKQYTAISAIASFFAIVLVLATADIALSMADSSQKQATLAPKKLTEAQMAKMDSNQLAHYIFQNHGCKNCHTLGSGGKLGFTEQGKEVSKGFEGCISLLTSMNVIAQTKDSDRTSDDKHKVARFHQFGCSECHHITPGKLGLTAYGAKLKSLHLACTDVERILSNGTK